jgi:hypothetical protein
VCTRNEVMSELIANYCSSVLLILECTHVISKKCCARRHSYVSVFLTQLLLMNCGWKIPYDSLTVVLLCGEMYTLGELVTADISTT